LRPDAPAQQEEHLDGSSSTYYSPKTPLLERKVRVIRNTGHDGAGSSSGPDSFQIFTRRLSDILYHENFGLTGSNASVGPAVSIGAGVIFGDLYVYGGQKGFIVTGGDSATVGAAGGFTQGGGVPGFLGHTWGLAADNALEFEIVTATVCPPPLGLPKLY
jgi:hypothetical protein